MNNRNWGKASRFKFKLVEHVGVITMVGEVLVQVEEKVIVLRCEFAKVAICLEDIFRSFRPGTFVKGIGTGIKNETSYLVPMQYLKLIEVLLLWQRSTER